MSQLSTGLSRGERGGTARKFTDNLEPLAVPPKAAAVLLNVRLTRVYELMRSNELESYLEGGKRLVMVRSIYARIERLLRSDGATGGSEPLPQPRSARSQRAASTLFGVEPGKGGKGRKRQSEQQAMMEGEAGKAD